MPEIKFKFGRGVIPLTYDEGRFDILESSDVSRALSDIEIGAKLDEPIGSEPLESIVQSGETVLFVVPDATRQVACGQIINLLVRRLIANGTAPFNIGIIFATGIHRPVTADEKNDILTPFIAQRIKLFDHSPRDLMQIMRFGETASGITVELNRALTEYDHVVLIGGVVFHYFAGFTGGRKLICPGLASAKTVSATHKLAFDCERKDRRQGVGTGLLDGNAVHEAFADAALFIKPSFCVTTIVDDSVNAVDVYCGDWIESHRAACDTYAVRNTVTVAERRDIVVASCGGSPYDINMIQAQKALESASHVCSDRGTIILVAECPDGLGRKDFLEWFAASNSDALAERLCEKYEVNGQTAWNLMRNTERFDVRMISSIDEADLSKMRIRKVGSLEDVLKERSATGYLLPSGRANFICDAD